MTIKTGSQCFMCRHKDEPRLVAAYLDGQIEIMREFLAWAENSGIKMGSISDDDLGGLYAQMLCNHDDAYGLRKYYPNIED